MIKELYDLILKKLRKVFQNKIKNTNKLYL